jgi:hypothetical protein
LAFIILRLIIITITTYRVRDQECFVTNKKKSSWTTQGFEGGEISDFPPFSALDLKVTVAVDLFGPMGSVPVFMLQASQAHHFKRTVHAEIPICACFTTVADMDGLFLENECLQIWNDLHPILDNYSLCNLRLDYLSGKVGIKKHKANPSLLIHVRIQFAVPPGYY